jgi:hypothetical protein
MKGGHTMPNLDYPPSTEAPTPPPNVRQSPPPLQYPPAQVPPVVRKKKRLSTGAIVAIVLGSIMAAILLYNVTFYIRYAYVLSTLSARTQSSVGTVVSESPDILTLPETPFSVGDTIVTDSMEIYVKSVQFTYEEHGYRLDSGLVYLVVAADIKNISKNLLAPDDEISVVAKYDTGYTYTGSVSGVWDNHDGRWMPDAVNPLESKDFVMYWRLPEEVETSGKPLSITFRIDGHDYTCAVR